jgi:hypothetical protein
MGSRRLLDSDGLTLSTGRTLYPADQRVAGEAVQRIDRQIDIELRPVQVSRARQLDARQLPYGRIAKPRKVLERNEPLALADQEPEPVR